MSQFYQGVTEGSLPPSVPTTFQTANGDAVPAANVINFTGIGGDFSGSGSTVTFTVTGEVTEWDDISGDVVLAVDGGYFCTAVLTATMPPSPSQGDIVAIISTIAGAVTLQANSGQTFQIGNTSSSVAGTCVSSQDGDSIEFVYRAADSTWYCKNSPQGTWVLS